MCAILRIFGGPNGSGKSTITSHQPPLGHYVNADEIKRLLGCSDLEAAQNAEQTREALLAQGESFTMESVLSVERNFDLMRRAKLAGYRIQCIFILTYDPAINIKRVDQRVRLGQHDVPTNKIVTRYWRALEKIPLLLSLCDECLIIDNSLDRETGSPSMIVSSSNGRLELYPNQIWSAEMLDELIHGTYNHVMGPASTSEF